MLPGICFVDVSFSIFERLSAKENEWDLAGDSGKKYFIKFDGKY